MQVAPVERGSATVGDRLISYRCFGAPPGSGTPTVLYAHGGLSCAADAALGHEPARSREVCLLAIDRPGVAGSDPLPDRTTASFAGDAAAVLDHLGIATTTAAVGWSLGGQYALACGSLLTERVPEVAVLAGVPPLSWSRVRRSLHLVDRTLLASVSPRVPAALPRVLFGALARSSARSAAHAGDGPARPGRAQRRIWGPADAAILASPAGALIDAAVAEATRSPDGMRGEYEAWEREWGFELTTLRSPVTVWQGDQDRWVPVPLARRLVGAMPNGTLRMCPGEGHLLPATRWGDVLDSLLATDR